jgi:hypothetical protein
VTNRILAFNGTRLARASCSSRQLLWVGIPRHAMPTALHHGLGRDPDAILTSGVIGGVSMKVLTADVERTYASTQFVDSPIDNVLTAGPQPERKFTASKIADGSGRKPFGSDHYPGLVVEQPSQ